MHSKDKNESEQKRRRSFKASFRGQRSVELLYGELFTEHSEWLSPDGHFTAKGKWKKKKRRLGNWNYGSIQRRDFETWCHDNENHPELIASVTKYRHAVEAGENLFPDEIDIHAKQFELTAIAYANRNNELLQILLENGVRIEE